MLLCVCGDCHSCVWCGCVLLCVIGVGDVGVDVVGDANGDVDKV